MNKPIVYLKLISICFLLVSRPVLGEQVKPSNLDDPLVYYGMAGCGPGSIIFRKNNRSSQLAAWVVNVISLRDMSLSFYVSSETSNCPPSHAIYNTKNYWPSAERQILRDYIAINFDNLRKDSARGTGLHLTGLAESFGCRDHAGTKRFMKISQTKFETIYGDKKGNYPDKVIDHYITFIQSDDVLDVKCRVT